MWLIWTEWLLEEQTWSKGTSNREWLREQSLDQV